MGGDRVLRYREIRKFWIEAAAAAMKGKDGWA